MSKTFEQEAKLEAMNSLHETMKFIEEKGMGQVDSLVLVFKPKNSDHGNVFMGGDSLETVPEVLREMAIRIEQHAHRKD